MVGTLANVTPPKANNPIAARLHVGILRLVELHPAALAAVWFRILVRLAVPVIAVKLNCQLVIGREGIYTELALEKMLRLIAKAKRVKQSITGALQFVRLKFLLFGVHCAKHKQSFGVFVAARQRAIGNVMVIALGATRRPAERITANLADVFGFIAPLPFVQAIHRTKAGFVQTPARDIKAIATPSTSDGFPVALAAPAGSMKTSAGTIDRLRPHTAGKLLSALRADLSSDFVFSYVSILPQSNSKASGGYALCP